MQATVEHESSLIRVSAYYKFDWTACIFLRVAASPFSLVFPVWQEFSSNQVNVSRRCKLDRTLFPGVLARCPETYYVPLSGAPRRCYGPVGRNRRVSGAGFPVPRISVHARPQRVEFSVIFDRNIRYDWCCFFSFAYGIINIYRNPILTVLITDVIINMPSKGTGERFEVTSSQFYQFYVCMYMYIHLIINVNFLHSEETAKIVFQ